MTLFYLLALVSFSINLAGFVVLSDVAQIFGAFPRSVFYTMIKNRFVLMAISDLAFVISVVVALNNDVPGGVLVIYAILFAATFFAGYWAAPLMVFPSQHKNARFAPVSEAAAHLQSEEEVMVVSVGDNVCAYPTEWATRPHIVGTKLGGEDVVTTYCGLSHLCVPFKDEGFNLKVMAQTECNVILVDSGSNKTIQQIYGTRVNDGTAIERYPAVFMTFEAYQRLYPDGTVFFNPPGNPLDRAIRKSLNGMLDNQYDQNQDRFIFRNVNHVDNRVPLKEQVYGVEINGEAKAYRLDDLREVGSMVDTIGGETITVKYFPDYDYIDVFYGDVPDITPQDSASKVPHANRILWGVWANFFRDTAVSQTS